MKTRAVILAGGEGTRLGTLTAKRTKPAVPFAGKYRIIDFTLSNCINSGVFDVMILVQYRPQSLIEHIGAGGPWDLNRDFSGVFVFTRHTKHAARQTGTWGRQMPSSRTFSSLNKVTQTWY
jgi:glucose-1-phosphate adenylyltransferase